MKFGKGYFKTFEQGIEREWLITNGLGGYSCSTIIGVNSRRHHGLLTASLYPPVDRKLILAGIAEEFEIENKNYELSAVNPTEKECGYKQLQSFIFDINPLYKYQIEDVSIDKKVSMVHGKNTVIIGYDIENGNTEIKLSLKPLLSYRGHEEEGDAESLVYEEIYEDRKLTLVPVKNKNIKVQIYSEAGSLIKLNQGIYKNTEYPFEAVNGSFPLDTYYIPAEYEIKISPKERARFSVICTIDDLPGDEGWDLILREEERVRGVIKRSGIEDELGSELVRASDQFIVSRKSTGMKTVIAGYPWFADWGRDTMIAFSGLTLVTKRFEDAREILGTFAKYIKNGLVPNMFPDIGTPPIYNTVDASLWYFNAVYEFLNYTGDYAFVKKNIYGGLKEIFEAYSRGTDFSIFMDGDGLISAGGGIDQVTWMDVRIGDFVVTPRHGKPVEINALWYNAIKIMEILSKRFGEDESIYRNLGEKVKSSFNDKFWDDKNNCLFDVVGKEEKNNQIRPNQIYAVSLPFTMLSPSREALVVTKVMRELYVTYGLRSLSREDSEYIGIYRGKLRERDLAYHQGTAWSFLLGAFITAYCKVNKHSEESISRGRRMLELAQDHLRDGCIGNVSEIFDGDEPNVPRGCFAQAWGVSELLRAYYEDILCGGNRDRIN